MRAVLHEGPIADVAAERILVEIGCTARSGVRRTAELRPQKPALFIDPIERIAPLAGVLARTCGGHFVRSGVLRPDSTGSADTFHDDLGVEWQSTADGTFAVAHPFAELSAAEIARRPLPALPPDLQLPDDPELRVILDAPNAGLIGTALALMGGWSFLETCASDPVLTSAVLDWTAELTCRHYEVTLRQLPRAPDLILYRDVFATEQAPFFSEAEFRRFALSRLTDIITTIRALSDAAIGVMLQGATLPLLPLVADLGVEVIGIDHRARGMIVGDVRNVVGRDVVLHGTADLTALGNCIAAGDLRGMATLACELAEAVPVIAAPADPFAQAGELAYAAQAAAFLSALEGEDLRDLSSFGPVRATIERAATLGRAARLPDLSADMPALLAIDDRERTQSRAVRPSDGPNAKHRERCAPG